MKAKQFSMYSVVVPVYNAAPTLRELCARTSAALEEQLCEMILVDDGSRDHSWQVMQQVANEFPQVRILQHTNNKGQCAALLTGMRQVKGDYVVTIDDDLQYRPEDIPLLIAEQRRTAADVVYGVPHSKQHSRLRNAGSRLLKNSTRWAGFPGEGSSFRLLTQAVAGQLCREAVGNDVLLEVLFHKKPYRFAFVNVVHQPRRHGASNYTVFRLLAVLLKSVVLFLRGYFPNHQKKLG